MLWGHWTILLDRRLRHSGAARGRRRQPPGAGGMGVGKRVLHRLRQRLALSYWDLTGQILSVGGLPFLLTGRSQEVQTKQGDVHVAKSRFNC